MSITSHYTAVHRAFREVGRSHGLPTEAVRVAVALHEHGWHGTVTELGRRLGLYDTAVHRALRALRAGEFVDRHDELTERGCQVAEDVVDAERGAKG